MTRTFRITTLGCKMNQYESSGMEELLTGEGYSPATDSPEVDIHIINTCTVTAKTDQRSRNAIRKARQLSPKATIIVTGCYAQRNPEELTALRDADFIVGNAEKTELVGFLRNLHRQPRVLVSDIGKTRTFSDFQLTRFSGYTRAFVKIQDGCHCHCSYCAVVEARGPSRSLPGERVIEQIAELHRRGYQEVVLTGINLGHYGYDLEEDLSLAGLLVAITERVPIPRIRLSSIEPQEWTEELITVIAERPRICRHFHIPLQSGSDRILSAMNRTYGREDFEKIVASLVELMPSVGIGADIIAGFPGETEEDFSLTESVVSSLPLSYLHAFGYSAREGTVAATMTDSCSPDVKKERVTRLRAISDLKRDTFRKSHIGKSVPVLVLSKRDRGTGKCIGLTDNYINVLFDGDSTMFNSFQTVTITAVNHPQVFGEITRAVNRRADDEIHTNETTVHSR